jgi:hypothetical protein
MLQKIQKNFCIPHRFFKINHADCSEKTGPPNKRLKKTAANFIQKIFSLCFFVASGRWRFLLDEKADGDL